MCWRRARGTKCGSLLMNRTSTMYHLGASSLDFCMISKHSRSLQSSRHILDHNICSGWITVGVVSRTTLWQQDETNGSQAVSCTKHEMSQAHHCSAIRSAAGGRTIGISFLYNLSTDRKRLPSDISTFDSDTLPPQRQRHLRAFRAYIIHSQILSIQTTYLVSYSSSDRKVPIEYSRVRRSTFYRTFLIQQLTGSPTFIRSRMDLHASVFLTPSQCVVLSINKSIPFHHLPSIDKRTSDAPNIFKVLHRELHINRSQFGVWV